MEKFMIGDRVVTTHDYWYPNMTGTIVSCDRQGVYGVDFDDRVSHFHNCQGKARPQHGRFVEHFFLDLLEDETVPAAPDLSAILGGV